MIGILFSSKKPEIKLLLNFFGKVVDVGRNCITLYQHYINPNPRKIRYIWQAMKSIRSIASVSLTLLVFISSTSFMVGMHVCSGKIENIALFSKAEGCEKERNLPPCHRHEKAPCCDDEAIVHEGEDFNASYSEVSVPSISFVALASPAIILSEIIPVNYLSKVKHFNYDTPLRACDLTVAHQVFLI